MIYASISADIVSSTTLPREKMIDLNRSIKECLELLESRYAGLWARIVRGDTIECSITDPSNALEIALILKTWIKSFQTENIADQHRFSRYGLRVAIGIGGMSTIDRGLDMMDGEAIYRSGRALDSLSGHSKYGMTISMGETEYEEPLNIILSLINQILNNATPRRCEVLCRRLLSGGSQETADSLGISVSGVNQTLYNLGWNSIEQAIRYYREISERL